MTTDANPHARCTIAAASSVAKTAPAPTAAAATAAAAAAAVLTPEYRRGRSQSVASVSF